MVIHVTIYICITACHPVIATVRHFMRIYSKNFSLNRSCLVLGSQHGSARVRESSDSLTETCHGRGTAADRHCYDTSLIEQGTAAKL
jgi:hypothetical protein